MDKTIQLKKYKVIFCKQLFLICILILSLIFNNACGKSKPKSTKSKDISKKSTYQKESINISKTQIEKDLANINLSKTNSNLKDNHAVMSKINDIYKSSIYEQKMIELRMRLNEKRKLEAKKSEEKYNNEIKRLRTLYYKYSNNWEAIPNERDRLSVVLKFLQYNTNRQEKIIDDLLNSSDHVVAIRAAIIRAYDFEKKGDINQALKYYNKGEKNILKNNKLSEVVEYLPEESREFLASLYHREGVMQFMNKNYNKLIENFSKCPLLYKNNPLKQANSYLELASAYAKTKNMNKIIETLKKAENSLKNFECQNDEERVSSYFLMKEIQRQQKDIQKNILPDIEWYH